MKKILKLAVLPLLFLSVMSCTSDDENTVATPVTGPELISPEDGTAIVLDELYVTNPAVTLVWNHAGYDVATEVNYTIEVAAADTDFAAPVVAGAVTTNRVATLTVGELNTAAVAAGLTPFEAGELDVRVVATLGSSNEMPMISNTVTLTVTPFETIVPVDPVLFLVGAPQTYYGLNAWDNATAIPMRYIGDGTTMVFEAYVKVAAGEGFKFIGQQGSWDNGNYGTIGGAQDGNLENGGGSSDIKVAEVDGSGLYYVQVDLDNLTYEAVKMNWGIIGSSTVGQWNDETAMTYDFATNKYTLSTTLTDGELKFRSGNTGVAIYGDAWKFNVGNSDPKVTYNAAAPNFAVTAGAHDLELEIHFDGTATVSGI